MLKGTTSRVTAAYRLFGEFYYFYSVRSENFGYHLEPTKAYFIIFLLFL